MKRTIFGILLAVLNCTVIYAQSFEGKLTFKVEFDFKTFKTKEFEITKEQVIEKMKSDGEYFDTVTITLKNGNYIKEDNSELKRKIIYKNDINKLYVFQNDIEQEIDIDANNHNALGLKFDEPKIEILETTKTINGINCTLLKLSWGSLGDELYYYNSEIVKLDPELFKNHNYEYFNTVVSITNSYPLEIIKTLNNFTSVKLTLVSISEEQIDDEQFNVKKIKNQRASELLNKKTGWSLFKDNKIGYSVEYPEEWIPQGSKGGFMCGLKEGFANSKFTIWWSEVSDKERMDFLFNDEGLYEGYDIIEKPIVINGLEGTYYLRTHKDKTEEYYESVVLKTKSTWYNISNYGIKDKWFEHFYKSFKLTK